MARLYVNNTFAKVEGSMDEHRQLYQMLSYKVNGWEAIKRRQIIKEPGNPYWRNWNGVKSAYDLKKRVFLTGLTPSVLQHVKRVGMEVDLIDKRVVADVPKVPDVIRLKDKKRGFITLYDYQMRTVKDFFTVGNGRGIAKIATGGGKTESAIAITKLKQTCTMFLTHRVNLLRQTAARFEERIPELKGHIGIIGDGNYDMRPVTIATVQTLDKMIKRDVKEVGNMLSPVRLLIIDEAHRSGASQFYTAASLCVNADSRLALTATPFMQENSDDDLCLMGLAGPIFSSVSNAELIKRGLLAQPYFTFFSVDQPYNMAWMKNWHDVYDHGIVRNNLRNSIIVKQANRLNGTGKKTLCVIDKIEHGKILESMMKDSGLKVQFVSGKAAASTREASLKKLATGKLDIIISTNIFDEGIDVKEIDAIILGAGGKSPVSFFQRIGRVIRKKDKDNYAIIIDFIDKQHPMLLRHSSIRYNYVKNEEGFIIL